MAPDAQALNDSSSVSNTTRRGPQQPPALRAQAGPSSTAAGPRGHCKAAGGAPKDRTVRRFPCPTPQLHVKHPRRQNLMFSMRKRNGLQGALKKRSCKASSKSPWAALRLGAQGPHGQDG